MKRIVLALLSLPLVAAAPAERRYSVTDFDRIRVDGPYEVMLVTGRGPSARAIGDSPAALDGISVEVQGRELRIRGNRSSSWGGYPGERGAAGVRLEVSTHGLRSAAITGPAQLGIDQVRSQRLSLSVAGSGGIRLGKVETDDLNLGINGSGAVQIAGHAKIVTATVIGTAELDGSGLITDQLQLNTESAGRVTLQARTAARIRASGIGETVVTGPAACTVDQRGRGQVSCGAR